MRKIVTRLLALLIALGAIGAVYVATTKQQVVQRQAGGPGGAGKRGGGGAGGGDAPVPVIGGAAKLADVPIYLEGVGAAKAMNTVTVRAQVDGKIMKLNFREGQTVQKGDLLAEIDPTTYKAALDQAAAKRALTETQLANARKDSDRYARIPGVIAQKTVDTQTALVAQLEAQVKADSAAIASAQAILDYTKVTAPLTGRTGLRLIDEGNLVRSGADAGIVTITQVQPISVLFTLPQQQLGTINRAQAISPLAVMAIDSDGKTIIDSGTLTVVDNAVDQTTGTVRMKADFPNATLQLWPGQFVNVRVLVETLKQVVVVPTPAVQRGPTGTFVYVVGAEDRVTIRPVQIAQQTDSETIVKAGIVATDRIITSGFSRLQDGARVILGQQGGEVPQKAPDAGGAPAGGAASAGAGRFERVRQVCATDIQAHCAASPREQMRQCMDTNKAKFSEACQSAIAERDATPKGDGSKGGGKGGSAEGRGKRGAAPSGAAQADPATTGAAPASSVTQ